MTLPRKTLLATVTPALLALAACATGPDPLLPPLAQVEVPVIEHRDVPRPKPKPAPISLVGQTRDQVAAFLGAPDLKRREAPAEIWRYGNEDCGVHLFFYETDGVMSVQHVETRLAEGSRMDEAECLDSLRRPSNQPAN